MGVTIHHNIKETIMVAPSNARDVRKSANVAIMIFLTVIIVRTFKLPITDDCRMIITIILLISGIILTVLNNLILLNNSKRSL